MKRFIYITSFITGLLAASSCGVYNAQGTSSARAAYGDSAADFRANKKNNQKRKKNALKSAKRKKTKNGRSSYFEGRPY